MNQINTLPNPSDFGLDFNYALWDAGTTIQFANVPWNADYRDIVRFDSDAALNAYITGQNGPVYENMTYARVSEPIRVELPFNVVYRYNYLRVTNPRQPIAGDVGRTFYYFIQDVRYVAPSTTEIIVQLDIWQTFNRDITFGRCYVERGHIGIANSNANADRGRQYLTVPEGLDLGTDYVIRNVDEHMIVKDGFYANSSGVLVVSSVDLQASGGTVDNPVLVSASGSSFENLPNGADLYYFNSGGAFATYMGIIADKPWMTQGIMSVTVVPQIKDGEGGAVLLPTGVGGMFKLSGTFGNKRVSLSDNFRQYGATGRYSRLTKFNTYPYMVVEVTTYSGNPLVLKPELIPHDSVEMIQSTHVVPPNPRVAFWPLKYNSDGAQGTITQGGIPINDNAEFFDMQVGIFNLPTFSVVNNGYMSFLASNANTLTYQHSSADWSQQRAMNAAAGSYAMGQGAISAQQQQNAANIQAMQANTQNSNSTAGWRALQGGANALAGGLMGGNPASLVGGVMGAANSAAGYAIDVNHANNALAISTQQANRSTDISVAQSQLVTNTNRSMAEFAAQGDYANAIAGINAKVQDAKMIQPTISGQIGGDAFNLAAYGWVLHSKVKTVDNATRAIIGEYWLRYGYAINRFTTPPADFHCMSKFTYWKMLETYIRSSQCPESFKQSIRGIFEKGVTVWRNPADIGTIDPASNEPLEGIFL